MIAEGKPSLAGLSIFAEICLIDEKAGLGFLCQTGCSVRGGSLQGGVTVLKGIPPLDTFRHMGQRVQVNCDPMLIPELSLPLSCLFLEDLKTESGP